MFPRLEPTAAGHQSIVLQACEAHGFPALAVAWSRIMGGELGRLIVGADQSQYDFTLAGKSYWMAWDIWQNALSLEPQDRDAANDIPRLFATLARSIPPTG
jgi:hypothetical protein